MPPNPDECLKTPGSLKGAKFRDVKHRAPFDGYIGCSKAALPTQLQRIKTLNPKTWPRAGDLLRHGSGEGQCTVGLEGLGFMVLWLEGSWSFISILIGVWAFRFGGVCLRFMGLFTSF